MNKSQWKLFKEWKNHVENLLLVSPTGIEMNRVEQELAEYGCGRVPLKEMGFKSWIDFLFEINDIYHVCHYPYQALQDPATRLFIFANNDNIYKDVNNGVAELAELVHGQRQAKIRIRRDGTSNTPLRRQVRKCQPEWLLKKRPNAELLETASLPGTGRPRITIINNSVMSINMTSTSIHIRDERSRYRWISPNYPTSRGKVNVKAKARVNQNQSGRRNVTNGSSKDKNPVVVKSILTKTPSKPELSTKSSAPPKFATPQPQRPSCTSKIKSPYTLCKNWIGTINKIMMNCEKVNVSKIPPVPPPPPPRALFSSSSSKKDNVDVVDASAAESKVTVKVNLDVEVKAPSKQAPYQNPAGTRTEVARTMPPNFPRLRDVPSPPRITPKKQIFYYLSPPEKMRSMPNQVLTPPRLRDVPSMTQQETEFDEDEIPQPLRTDAMILVQDPHPQVHEEPEMSTNLQNLAHCEEIPSEKQIDQISGSSCSSATRPETVPNLPSSSDSGVVRVAESESLFPDNTSQDLDDDDFLEIHNIETKSSTSVEEWVAVIPDFLNDEDGIQGRVERVNIDPGFLDEEVILRNRHPVPRPTPEEYLQPRRRTWKSATASSAPEVERVKRINYNEL